jgi:DNA polymerase I-like protein with 3'-5' exonuclease and polymerase domains
MAGMLRARGVSLYDYRLDNVVRRFFYGNPDPSPELIAKYTTGLIREIHKVNPSIIIAVGRFAMRWLLGEDADLDTCHGMPFKPGAYDPSRYNRAPKGCIVVCTHHPAEGFHKERAWNVIGYDFDLVGRYIRGFLPCELRIDKYAGKEVYRDITGEELADILSTEGKHIDRIGFDTEGLKTPFSAQFSWQYGTGYMLRCTQPNFLLGMKAFERWAVPHYEVSRNPFVVTHCASTPDGTGYDLKWCLPYGLDFRRLNQRDTMRNLYLLRGERLSLKYAATRLCGMEMIDYMSLLEGELKQLWLAYLQEATLVAGFCPQLSKEPDGTQPQRLSTLLKLLFTHYGKNNDLDVKARFENFRVPYQKFIIDTIGPAPEAELDILPLDQAVFYGCRDSDATLRVDDATRILLQNFDDIEVEQRLPSHTNIHNLDRGNRLLPMWFYMQETGLPVDVEHLQTAGELMATNAEIHRKKIIETGLVNDDFNPGSPDETAQLLTTLHNEGIIDVSSIPITKKGIISTDKKHIEKFRYECSTIEHLFQSRENLHNKNSFSDNLIESVRPDGTVRALFNPVGTVPQRLATEKPNVLNLPSRKEVGKAIRKGIKAPNGFKLISVDYSGLELRVIAEMSKDPLLSQIFLEGRNPHREYAEYLSKEPITNDKDPRYYGGKKTNFSVGYGMAAPALYQQMHQEGFTFWTIEQVEEAISSWWVRYPGAAAYKRLVTSEVKSKGYVRDKSGMIRYLPKIFSKQFRLSEAAIREAFSLRIQGTAQLYIQNAMLPVWEYVILLQDCGCLVWVLLQVHDELVLMAEEDIAETVANKVQSIFIEHSGASRFVPYKADSAIGQTLGDL